VKTEKPAVTVVLPLYNKEAEVKRAVESVLSQTVSNFELVLVNDGSTDKGPEKVRGINDSRIRIIDQENAGVSAARNRGIIEARADLIAFLDADDEWKPSFLETILNLKDKFSTCSVFATNYLYREVNGKYRLPIIRGLPPHPWEGILEDYFGVAVKSDPPLWTSAVAVIKEAILSVDLFPIGVTSGEDLLTWARLALKYRIAYSSTSCSEYWIPSKPRMPDINDVVGKELFRLMKNTNGNKANKLKKYISLWHRMRAQQFLYHGDHKSFIRELSQAIHYSRIEIKSYIYMVFAIMPKYFSKSILNILKFGNEFKRRLL